MSRQDKATTERHTRTLRELVKRPENKVCADCKRNDPRWASWNLGVFLCIRCSGIHRGMGTHISKVKSVDLDTWTPEQMESIMKWGNRRANAYWEAHLKAGHVPPEHKMESFVRSKYESRRWAMEGPPPSDPSVLDGAASSGDADVKTDTAPSFAAPAPVSSTRPTRIAASQPAAPLRSAAGITTTQPQPRQLLSSAIAGRSLAHAPPAQAPAAAAAAPAPAAAAPQNDLFSLDFHAPAAPAAAPASQRKDVKQDILSLFSSAPAAPAAPASAFGQFGAAPAPAANAWGAAPPAAQPQSMVGASGAGMWGVSSGWNAPAPAAPAQANVWGAPAPAQPQQQQSLFNTNDVWGAPAASGGAAAGGDPFGAFSTGGAAAGTAGPPKKDDAFGDIWGGFK